MDMHLPKMTGLETMEVVRQIRGVLPTILISADNDEKLLRKALAAHVFCVLAKPVSRHAVIYVVNKAIEKFY
jgi:CheY-like chemotaxis protein